MRFTTSLNFCSGLIAPAFAVALLLLISPAFGQDEKARCDAKRGEIAQLEKKTSQLSAFVIPPVRTAQTNLSRTDLGMLNSAMSELSSANWETSPTIAEFLNSVRNRGGFAAMADQYEVPGTFAGVSATDKESLRAFIAATRAGVVARIDLLKSFDENPDAAAAALKESEAKVAERKAELAKMKCDETDSDENDPATETVKKTPCDAKRDEIAALRAEVGDLTPDAFEDRIESTRDALGILSRAITNTSDPDWRATQSGADFVSLIVRGGGLKDFANRYGVLGDFANVNINDRNAMRQYIQTIRPFVTKRLDRLLLIRNDPGAARAARADAESRLKSASKDLETLGCDRPETEETDCSIEGSWTQYATGLGRSTWHVTSDGKAIESGLGASTGTASMTKNVMRIEWSNPNGWSGYYEWTMDAECRTGSGTLVFKSGGTGSRTSTVEHN